MRASHLISRALILTNCLVVPLALVVYLFPTLIVVGLFLLILPGIIAAVLPTLAIYLVIFTAGWFTFQRRHWSLGFAAGIAAVTLFGVWLPVHLNSAALAELASASPQNRDPGRPFGRADAVAIERVPAAVTADCDDLCQALLYNGQATRVIIPPPRETSKKRSPSKRHYTVYRIVQATRCPPGQGIAHEGYGQWLPPEDARTTRTAVLTRIAAGDCLIREEADRMRVDLTIRRIDTRPAPMSLALRSAPVISSGLALLDADDRVFAAEVTHCTETYQVPLNLEPISSGGGTLGMVGWKWRSRSTHEGPEIRTARGVSATLRRLTGFALDPPKGASGLTTRQQLDRVLDDTSLPSDDPAFALLEIYYQDLEQEEPLTGDSQRLGRLIRDSRITNFEQIPRALARKPALAPAIQDAMLDRLLMLGVSSRRPPMQFEALQRLAEALPPGAFADGEPRIERILANRRMRESAPTLILRLTDRGAAARPVLLGILRESRPPDWGRDANAAIAGLCSLGRLAKDELPALLELQAQGVIPEGIHTSLDWRAMLVSLGADPSTFSPAGKGTSRAEYGRQLRDRAAQRCGARP